MDRNDEVKHAVQEQFGKNAQQYVESKTHAQGDDLQLLVQWLAPQNSWKVLDIATGGGHVARTLAPHVAQVVATDLTRPMLAAAAQANQAEKNILYVQADAESLPFLAESFDLVTCRIAAHHFPDPNAFVREVSRVLRPGGWFLFIDNVSPEAKELASFVNLVEQTRDPSHVHCLSVTEWRELHSAHDLVECKERLRKKPFAFLPWVQRTSESPEQEKAVEQMLLNAPKDIQAYVGLQIEQGRVMTYQIDEWMVMCQKQGGTQHDTNI
ncbi:class I SAM-dependent methyltransferase [Mesorhizobium sp. M00.F.Ca.ET.186.01.1.1]|nr:class I SAM-dependent methyltransferase [Mesorhizobium sp. M00.F.Ca.ET.186.01.1.1]